MTALDVLRLLAGAIVLVMVVSAMVMMTPSQNVDVHSEGSDSQGSNLSPTQSADDPAPYHSTAHPGG